MPHTLFISDLHLNADEPATVARFEAFCRDVGAGDDDAAEAFNARIIGLLQQMSTQVGTLYLQHGNRDFLLGPEFAKAAGLTLLADPCEIDLYGRKAIISHGDALCTDDLAYQQFRQMVRNPQWQAQFLSQPLPVRKAIAEDLRRKSEASKQEKAAAIMDVNADAVASLFARFPGITDLIHGHTHRPACHTQHLDANEYRRWVLPDWYEGKWGYLHCSAVGWHLQCY